MLQTTFTDPLETETIEEICWHNLMTADKYLNLQYFIAAATGWIKLNPTKNYQDLEKELRTKNLNTHLIASKSKNISGTHLGLCGNNDKTDCEYECIFSCRPKEFAVKELLEHWPSYDINFEKLDKAGSIIADSDDNDAIDNKNFKKFNDQEVSSVSLIADGKKKLTIVQISPEKFLSNLIEMAEKKFNKTPSEKIVGLTKSSGEPIFGLFLEDKLLSDIGFVIKINSQGDKSMELFDLKKLF